MNKFDAAPQILKSFLIYIESIQGKSQSTAEEYFYDIRTFFRYLKYHFNMTNSFTEFDKIDISDVDLDLIKKVDLNLIYEYMNFLNREKNNSTAARARKIASLRSYFKYLTVKKNFLEENPIKDLESIKIKKSNPQNLTIDDSLALLSAVSGKNATRDYCIITLFLNCGMRLAELVSLDLTDVRNDTLVITGKGNKQRTVYLNEACMNAIKNYMEIRKNMQPDEANKNALFLSSRNRRISRRMVQQTVENNIKKLGLDPRKYTTHKLRHTAATLMYQSGADIRALQEILGHEHLSTTEIYTHVDNEQIRETVENNPLSWVKREENFDKD